VALGAAEKTVAVESDGGVARILLRRPPLNVLDLPMIEELNAALDAIARQPGTRAAVIAAEGKAFSAGVSVQDHLPEKVDAMLRAFHGVFRRIWSLPCPTVAAVQGAALGGGCELACFADVVIASDNASFAVPEIKLGVFPPIAAVHFPERIGLARTLKLVLTGETLTAREAERIGLVDQVTPPDELRAAVNRAAASFREKSAAALRLARRAVHAAVPFEARLAEAESAFLGELMRTADAVEGLRAFIEKRTPVWMDR
jgi:cyclohexa-1,5-dienecarbonyl-CoA hydratase